MEPNLEEACNATGFVPVHAAACQEVATRVNAIILFREPGKLASKLIEEGYSMKGFRIDTKSCNWGPMAGFVCVDPRLTKADKFHEENIKFTYQALSGHIVEDFFGKVNDTHWKADVMPIVISKTRFEELSREKIIFPRQADRGEITGQATNNEGNVVLHYRLVPTRFLHPRPRWLRDAADHYVVCINEDLPRSFVFVQRYPEDVQPIKFNDRITLLGMTNPDTKDRGFKACVTADYDLFAIWPPKARDVKIGDVMNQKHVVMAEIQKSHGLEVYDENLTDQQVFLPGGVRRMDTIDTRLKGAGLREHHRFGNVSARVMLIKALLNSALQGMAAYPGGNAIHHNDEAGNFAHAKGSLSDCLPLIGFLPYVGTVLIKELAEFRALVEWATQRNYEVIAKPTWLAEAGA